MRVIYAQVMSRGKLEYLDLAISVMTARFAFEQGSLTIDEIYEAADRYTYTFASNQAAVETPIIQCSQLAEYLDLRVRRSQLTDLAHRE